MTEIQDGATTMNSLFMNADFSDLPEFGVGHFTNLEAMTGCTCFVARGDRACGVTCGIDVRGGGPATRETDLLKPENMVQKVNAVMIGGGSAFGLEAANGAMQILADKSMGFAVGPVCVPIVPAACLFDLLLGEPVWPDQNNGASACESALNMDKPILEMGSVGAGTGAMIGRMGLPEQASKSGFGWSGARFGNAVVIACVAVNAVGNIIGNDGSWLAGVTDRGSGNVLDPMAAFVSASEAMRAKNGDANGSSGSAASLEGEKGDSIYGHPANTTLGVILTNAPLTKAQATKVAQQTHDGYARAIKPVHTLNDGDAVFAMASGTMEAPEEFGDFLPDLIGIMAADAMEDAIRNGVAAASL